MKDSKPQMNGSSEDRVRKGLWSVEEDQMLLDYVNTHGKGHWNRVSRKTGLKRSGKSCRLRWMNYLSPSVKRERFTEDEDDLIIRLHKLLGNRWALIAGRVPGRTDNQVKNYWNTHLSKKLDTPNTQPAHSKPVIMHNCSELRSCCSGNNLSTAPADDQMISSDFSSNTTCGTKTRSVTVPIETANTEEEDETNIMKESVSGDVANRQIGALQTSKADELRQIETVAADAGADDDGDHGSCCFMQYLDDYTLHFVLNNNKRNNAASATAGM
uniref:Uncharacterized protein n=1 Tax=Kalanchoe fedtschenkoi TaxID=63787 RepID=A0A7N1A901_KALFE